MAWLPRFQRRPEGVEQRRVAERLEEARHSPAGNEAWAEGRVSLSGDEDDRDELAPPIQFLLQVRSTHAGQSDVEDQGAGEAGGLRPEEGFGRFERLNVVSR